MKTILVTGFEPFDGDVLNPSLEVARAVDGALVGDEAVVGTGTGTGGQRRGRIVARELPCVIDAVGPALAAAIDETRPAIVLCLGLAGGRPDISIERVAINLVDARIPDNAGCQPVDEPVLADAPAAYFSSLPIKAMAAALRDQGIPASISQSAGTFACNAVFFHLAHLIATRHRGLRGGFVHVPYLPSMAARHPGTPSLSLATLSAAVRLLAATALRVDEDLAEAGGALH